MLINKEKHLSITEISEELGRAEKTIHGYVSAGLLHPIRVNGRHYVPEHEVLSLKEKLKPVVKAPRNTITMRTQDNDYRIAIVVNISGNTFEKLKCDAERTVEKSISRKVESILQEYYKPIILFDGGSET